MVSGKAWIPGQGSQVTGRSLRSHLTGSAQLPWQGGDYWRDTLEASNIIPPTPKIGRLRLREGRLLAHYNTAHLRD